LAVLRFGEQFRVVDLTQDILTDANFRSNLRSAPLWSPDAIAVILLPSPLGDDPTFQIVRRDRVVLSRNDHSGNDAIWASDSSAVYDWEWDAASETRSLVRFDAYTGERTLILSNLIGERHFSPDQTEAVVGMLEDGEFTLQRVDVATGARTIIARGAEWENYSDPNWSSDGSVITVVNTSARRIARLRHGDAAPQVFTQIDGMSYQSYRDYVIWREWDGTATRIWKTDYATGTDTLLDLSGHRDLTFALSTYDDWFGYYVPENIALGRYEILHVDDGRRLSLRLPEMSYPEWPGLDASIAPDGLGGIVRSVDGKLWWFAADGEAEWIDNVEGIKGVWSPDGAAFAYLPGIDHRRIIIQTRTGLRREFQVPDEPFMPLWAACDAVPRLPSP
jgi:hypothetical protein